MIFDQTCSLYLAWYIEWCNREKKTRSQQPRAALATITQTHSHIFFGEMQKNLHCKWINLLNNSCFLLNFDLILIRFYFFCFFFFKCRFEFNFHLIVYFIFVFICFPIYMRFWIWLYFEFACMLDFDSIFILCWFWFTFYFD